MDDIERKRLEELFNKVPGNEAEAVENAKDCLDACLQHLGEKAEFILFVKAPHEAAIKLNRCACAKFTIAAANRLAEHLPAHIVSVTRKLSLLSKLRDLFKRGAK